ncbi:acyltransferase [Paenibacillus taiwanensis]|uniref:acyltransferase n=1 Tax=Paenibacillus taiwanensis TaxID=401638 RepID=UPI00040872C5|nr:acyltransferase [Paenibacillus taiwanensis]
MSKKETITSLSIYRALAMLAVLLIHSTSEAVAKAQQSDLYYVYTFLNIFSKFAVPAFIALTSFVLFYNYASDHINWARVGTFYRKRIKLILVPYLISSICYFAVVHMMAYRGRGLWDTLESLVLKLATGSAYTHLYYVFLLIQFYLLFPLLLLAFRSKLVVKYAILIGLILQWGFVIWNKYELLLPQKGSVMFSYMSYWMLGAYLGLKADTLKGWFNSLGHKESPVSYSWWNRLLWSVWFLMAVLQIQIWYWTNLGEWRMNTLWYEAIWNVHAILSCLVLIQAASYIERKWKSSLVTMIHRFGEVTFGVYLLHPIILLLYRKWPWHHGQAWAYPLYIGGGFVLALGLSWLVVAFAFRRFSWSWILFGSLPKPLAAHTTQQQKSSSQSVQG